MDDRNALLAIVAVVAIVGIAAFASFAITGAATKELSVSDPILEPIPIDEVRCQDVCIDQFTNEVIYMTQQDDMPLYVGKLKHVRELFVDCIARCRTVQGGAAGYCTSDPTGEALDMYCYQLTKPGQCKSSGCYWIAK